MLVRLNYSDIELQAPAFRRGVTDKHIFFQPNTDDAVTRKAITDAYGRNCDWSKGNELVCHVLSKQAKPLSCCRFFEHGDFLEKSKA